MHHPSGRHLALVATRPEPQRDPDENALALGTDLPTDQVPFAVRMTMVQILEVAEDAEIRADIIDDVTSALGAEHNGSVIRRGERPDHIERRVGSLREVACDLRSIADQMIGPWTGSERTS